MTNTATIPSQISNVNEEAQDVLGLSMNETNQIMRNFVMNILDIKEGNYNVIKNKNQI